MKHLQSFEKWDGDVKVKKTGEYSDKTIQELEQELDELKAKSKSYQEQDKSVPKKIIEKEAEIKFAIRAKKHWKK
jgi:predicted HTH domain antitoxin